MLTIAILWLKTMKHKAYLMSIYYKLYSYYGHQGWWPADSPFEVAIGAILTQNTNWSNVEKAINNLKKDGCLNPESLRQIPLNRLSELIKPSGYYNIKAKRLKAFIDFLYDYAHGNIEMLKEMETNSIRQLLLMTYGIGPETADSILLYALGKPVFVIDAYTKRVLLRHNILQNNATYEECQNLFHMELEQDVQLYNEYHALFVRLGKDFCKPKPLCNKCPLF